MKWLSSIIDGMSEWVSKATAFLIGIVAILVTLEVVLRYGFNSPTQWNWELVIYLSGAVYILGYAYTHSMRADVRVDAIYRRFTPRIRAIVNLASSLLLFIFFGGILWASGKWAWTALAKGLTSGTQWDVPIFPARAAIPLAALLVVLQAIVIVIRDFKTAISGREDSEH